jgi:hypothetical protein
MTTTRTRTTGPNRRRRRHRPHRYASSLGVVFVVVVLLHELLCLTPTHVSNRHCYSLPVCTCASRCAVRVDVLPTRLGDAIADVGEAGAALRRRRRRCVLRCERSIIVRSCLFVFFTLFCLFFAFLKRRRRRERYGVCCRRSAQLTSIFAIKSDALFHFRPTRQQTASSRRRFCNEIAADESTAW